MMTYPNDEQSTMEVPMVEVSAEEAPAWLRTLRYLVFGLIGMSIVAMAMVGFAAVALVIRTTTPPVIPEVFDLPEGAVPMSVTETDTGAIVVYELDGYHARIFTTDGSVVSESAFQ